ncbi:MAG: ATP-binding protein, partial [Candidatus Gracilibacteria bacterium]|nr:ATP-binding protein [Candidatus Gracilibacteria bacterium]
NLNHVNDEKGSIEWLDIYVYETIKNYSDVSKLNTFYFGKIPSIEHKEEYELNNFDSNKFIIDFDSITPPYLRVWSCHLSGKVEYLDILQDVISIYFLNNNLSPKEVTRKYYDAGLYQEILESKLILSRLKDNEINEIVACSEINSRGKIELLKKSESLENKITQCLDAKDDYNIIDEDEEFLLIFDSLEEINEKIQQWTHKDEYSLNTILNEIEVNERRFSDFQKLWYEKYNINHEEAKENCNWLNCYQSERKYTPENISFEKSKKTIQDIKIANNEKRSYITKIKSIIKNNELLSDNILNGLDVICNNIDRPGYWSAKLSCELSDNIELLFLTRDEWYRSLLNSLGIDAANTHILPIDNAIIHHLEKTLITRLTNKKYEFDIFDVFNSSELKNLSETATYLKKHKYLTVENSNSKKKHITSETPQTLGMVLEKEKQNIFDIKPFFEIINNACDDNVIEKYGMNDLLVCISEDIDYECLSNKALSVWKYVIKEGKKDFSKEDILSIWLLAELVRGINNYGDSFEGDVISILFRYPNGHIRSRIDYVDIISQWPLIRCQKGDDLQTKIFELLQTLHEGNNKEELNSFEYVLKNTNPGQVVKIIWEIQKNNKKLTQSSRFYLLSVLYKLNHYDSIDKLFKTYSSNDEYRYLDALLKMHIGFSTRREEKYLHTIQKYSKIILEGSAPNPIKDFISSISTTAISTEYKQEVDFLTMEKTSIDDIFRVVLIVKPAIEDPPLSLSVKILSDEKLSDFKIAEEDTALKEITKDEPLFEALEVEFLLESRSALNSGRITVLLEGETVGNVNILQQESYDYEDAFVQEYHEVSHELIRDIYNGESNLLSGKPALHDEFIGRRDELENLKRSTSYKNQPLIILYGVRRLGKTSILYKLRDEACATNNSRNNILYIPVAVDNLSFKVGNNSFDEQLFKHIKMSIRSLIRKDNNVKLFFKKNNISSKDIMKIAEFKGDDKGLPFTEKLDIFVSELIKLIGNSVQSVVLLFDEFDKFVEYYRNGHKSDIDNIINQLRSISLDPNNSIGIVIAGSDIMKIMFSDYRNAMYGSSVQINLQTLNKASNKKDAIELIQPTRLNGKKNFEHVIQQIIDFTGGHPLYMRVLSYMSAILSKQVLVRPSTVNKAVRTIFSNDNALYTGGIVDKNVFTAPLNAISLFEKKFEQKMARLLLALISKITTIENPKVQWVQVYKDETLETIAAKHEWVEIRNTLVEASLLEMDSKRYCSIKFPILAESLRSNNTYETILETIIGGFYDMFD